MKSKIINHQFCFKTPKSHKVFLKLLQDRRCVALSDIKSYSHKPFFRKDAVYDDNDSAE